MKIFIKPFVIATIFFLSFPIFSQESKLLKFTYKDGDLTRILSTVEEDVLVNGVLDHHATILNRVSVNTTVDEETEEGYGKISANFMTSEQNSDTYGKAFSWEQNYESEFLRSSTGKYTIGDEYFMPVVRDVPIFPDYEVKPGDTWTAEGHEAHDMRQTFKMEKPFKIPFEATYTYKGTETDEHGKVFDVISVKYNIYYETPMQADMNIQELMTTPASTMGYSNQTLYWDNERGILDHYTEEFRIVLTSYFGDEYIFDGTAFAQTDEFTRTNTEENLEAIQAAVEELGLENVTVTQGELGLTISIENIQFEAESAILKKTEKDKLDKMAEIFAAYQNDLLITGYTALAGTTAGRQKLSEERAKSVADYLISQKVRPATSVFTEGKGAQNPIADNKTAEGRARNRRVEITFLDK